MSFQHDGLPRFRIIYIIKNDKFNHPFLVQKSALFLKMSYVNKGTLEKRELGAFERIKRT